MKQVNHQKVFMIEDAIVATAKEGFIKIGETIIDNKLVEAAIGAALVTGTYLVAKGLGDFFSNSKAEIDSVNVDFNGVKVSDGKNKKK